MLPAYLAVTLVVAPTVLLVCAGLVLLLERRLIALAQRRLGFGFHGRHGWAHLPADVFKFWLKSITRHEASIGFGVFGLMAGAVI